MNKATKLVVIALGLGGIGYFLYKKGLFSQEAEPVVTLGVIDKDIKTAVEPDDSEAVALAKKAKDLADAELARLAAESEAIKIAIEAEKARLAKLLVDAADEQAVREAATAEAQRVRLAQIEADRVASLESERIRLGKIEAARLESERLRLMQLAADRQAAIEEAARLEALRVAAENAKYLINSTPIVVNQEVSQLVDTSDEPEEITVGRNRYAYEFNGGSNSGQVNMELNQMLYL